MSSSTETNSLPHYIESESGLPVYCRCGTKVVLRTSQTDRNPGRLFFICPRMSAGPNSHLFKWADEAMMEEVETVRDVVAEVEATVRILEDEKTKCDRAMMEKFEMVRHFVRELEATVTLLEEEKNKVASFVQVLEAKICVLEEEKQKVGSVVQLLESKICEFERHVMIFKHRFRYFTMTNLTTAIFVGVLFASFAAAVSYAF